MLEGSVFGGVEMVFVAEEGVEDLGVGKHVGWGRWGGVILVL